MTFHGRSNTAVRSILLFSLVFLILILGCETPREPDIDGLIAKGEFRQAETALHAKLASDISLTPEARLHWEFEIERMRRIRVDFTKTESDVLEFIKKWIPQVTATNLRQWEESKALECMMIDGEKRYFKYAAQNLFRVDPEARKIWKTAHQQDPPPAGLEDDSVLDQHLREVMTIAERTKRPFVRPVRIRVTHTIAVPPGVVPPGEILRCWIPFPREIPGRQDKISLLSAEPERYLIADNDRLQRTVYCEKSAVAAETTRFVVTYDYLSSGVYYPVDPSTVASAEITPELSAYVREEPPHIVFTPELKQLSKRIVGSEKNPYRIAQNIFAWVDTSVTWASAREYSTVPNLSMYPFDNKHGDCGMQTMLFITLCRMNGIPARWQSGWEFRPPGDTMHDWGMIYFAPYGWVPMDVTYGMRKTDDERLKWFYLNGMDSYRLIFNDGFSQPFYPAKVYPRSETVDLQKGEVEWRGGNLYFNQWDWKLEWQVME